MVNKEQKDLKTNKRLNLKNDIIFKAFFSREGNKEFLIDFLNALLKIEIRDIKIREEVSLEQLSTKEKGGRLDLQAEIDNGIIINIEMQIRNNNDIEERTTLYSSKVLSRETQRGKEYKDIKKVIMINILDYEMLGFDEYISETAIVLEKHREYEVLKGLKWYFIELPKFRRQNPDMREKINQWIAFIDDYDKEVIEMAEKENKTLKKARKEMNYLTGDEAVRRMAELEEKWEMDRVSELGFAKREGIKEGIEKGEKQGKKEIIKKLLESGIKIEEIENILQLSKEEIERIVNS